MSNQMKEFEARVMISEEDFYAIMDFYRKRQPALKIIKNENYYFDTASMTLANNRVSLRLRVIDEQQYEFTCKIKEEDGSIEITDFLNMEAVQLLLQKNIIPLGEVKKYLSLFPEDINHYRLLASLTNERVEIKENDHLLVIDKNIYGQSIDYNLEVESTDLSKAQQVLAHYRTFFKIKESNEKYRGKAWRAIDGCNKKI